MVGHLTLKDPQYSNYFLLSTDILPFYQWVFCNLSLRLRKPQGKSEQWACTSSVFLSPWIFNAWFTWFICSIYHFQGYSRGLLWFFYLTFLSLALGCAETAVTAQLGACGRRSKEMFFSDYGGISQGASSAVSHTTGREPLCTIMLQKQHLETQIDWDKCLCPVSMDTEELPDRYQTSNFFFFFFGSRSETGSFFKFQILNISNLAENNRK